MLYAALMVMWAGVVFHALRDTDMVSLNLAQPTREQNWQKLKCTDAVSSAEVDMSISGCAAHRLRHTCFLLAYCCTIFIWTKSNASQCQCQSNQDTVKRAHGSQPNYIYKIGVAQLPRRQAMYTASTSRMLTKSSASGHSSA